MIEAATGADHPYDLVVVHSFSRFFRDQFEFERYRRQLQKAKVEVLSITQDVGEGHMADLVRSILNKFDEPGEWQACEAVDGRQCQGRLLERSTATARLSNDHLRTSSRQGQEEARDRRQRSTVGPQDLRSLSQWRWRGWTDGGEEDRIVAQWSWIQL